MTSSPKVSICFPTLDNYDLLGETLKSLKEHTSVDYEVIIADNGSHPRGYVHPMNKALHAAEGEILIAFNDDILVSPGWIEPLIEECEKGTWVCFPDQETTDGLQCICGWCIAFSNKGFIETGGFDETFDLWCGDIDLAKRLIDAGHPPVRVKLPKPLVHLGGGTNTIGNQGYREYMNPTGMTDIDKYRIKWGRDVLADKRDLIIDGGPNDAIRN